MNCGVKWCLIRNFDYYSIVFLGINHWSRKYAVYCNDVLGVAKLSDSHGLHL